MYFKLKQGKDITAQVICVRGMEHAVRQYEAQRSTEAKRSAECPDPCVSKGHAQKNFIYPNIIFSFTSIPHLKLKHNLTHNFYLQIRPMLTIIRIPFTLH
ncbi:MAG: hypothetical protein NZ519_04580 [Bacteroidia bacterium]|nr:hypothetical protein [Bacteroidia bacterium]